MYLPLQTRVCDYLIVPALPFYIPTSSTASSFMVPVGAGRGMIHVKPLCDSTKWQVSWPDCHNSTIIFPA